jgi:hypothetical protein
MNITASFEGFYAAMHDAQDEDRLLSIKEAQLVRDLDKVRTLRVGAKEKALKAKQDLLRARARQVREEVTLREVDIARMRGMTLALGEPLTIEIKSMLYPAPQKSPIG